MNINIRLTFRLRLSCHKGQTCKTETKKKNQKLQVNENQAMKRGKDNEKITRLTVITRQKSKGKMILHNLITRSSLLIR